MASRSGIRLPIIGRVKVWVLLLIGGVAAYSLNWGGFRDTVSKYLAKMQGKTTYVTLLVRRLM
jgi:hypothetical protein